MKALSRPTSMNDTGRAGQPSRATRTGSGKFLPTLVALGGSCALIVGPADALELGNIRVESSLGQPLRASIAYALNPGEQISSHCIWLRSGMSANGLPAVSNARIRVTGDAIRLTGAPVTEPMVSLRLNVNCPDTARLGRDYAVFVDPPSPGAATAPVTAAERAPAVTPMRRRAPETAAEPPAPAPAPVREPVTTGSDYRVRPGDTLSGIAARIADREQGLWQTVDALFAANPQAFVGGDRDRLLAGALLVIPDSVLAEPGSGVVLDAAVAATEAPAVSAPVEQAPATDQVQSATADTADSSDAGRQAMADTATAAAGAPPATEAVTPTGGDVTLETDGPFVSPIESPRESTIEPAETPRPQATASVPEPAVSAPVRAPAANAPATGRSSTWLLWLGGSGIALILALLLFGRKLKERFAPEASGAFGRRGTDTANSDDTTTVVAAIAETDLVDEGYEVDIDDDSSVADSGEIDLAQDFGYAPGEFDDPDTLKRAGSLAADRFSESAILESEILPSDDTGEYDLSMIVDATRQPVAEEEDTARNLGAVQLDSGDAEAESDNDFTLSRELDYKILEQDYQDELTATQALDAELTKAASELTLQGDDHTSEMPAAEDEETAHLPVADMLADDETAALPREPAADLASASTVAMQPEGVGEDTETTPGDSGVAEAAEDSTGNADVNEPAERSIEDSNVSEGMASGTADAENDDAATEKKSLKAS